VIMRLSIHQLLRSHVTGVVGPGNLLQGLRTLANPTTGEAMTQIRLYY